MRGGTMKKTTWSLIPLGIRDHDPNLELISVYLVRTRSKFLDLEPGSKAQERAYQEYERTLKLQATGQQYVPKF